MYFMLSAAPPRASPSILVRIEPVILIAFAKSLATFTASWPVRLSKTSIVSRGLISFSSKLNSLINPSSTFILPAVSYKTQSISCNSANCFALDTISIGI